MTRALTPVQQEMDDRDWTFGGTWPYKPHWFTTSDGVRIHYVDEGRRDGEPVVMLHGNPSWSYLYRRFIGPLADAGYRAVAHDEMGFGRSDKPERESEYTIQRHVDHFAELVDDLRLEGVTLVLQDWGGPIGLAWAVDAPERVRRLAVFNTAFGSVPPGMEKPPLPFRVIRAPGVGDFLVKRLHVFTRLVMFKGGIAHRDRLGEHEKQAYLAPHPTAGSRAGVMAYPRLIPWDEGNPTKPLARHTDENLDRLSEKPMLICWPLKDPAFGRREVLEMWRRRFPHAEVHEFEDASHFIQEDAHERVVPLLLDFLGRT